MELSFENRELNTKQIIVDEMGQRDVEQRKAQFHKIMRTFNPLLVNDVKVALIDGKYYCVDGQMTMKVLKARNKGKDLCVKCKVYTGLTLMDAAEMFVNQNGTVSKVDFVDKLRVLNNYGDRDAVDFVRVTESNGLEIAWKKTRSRNAIQAVSTAFRIFKEFNSLDDYGKFIRVIKGAWGGEPVSLRSEILNGVALFMKTYKGKFKEAILIEKLRAKLPMDIIRDAQADRSSGNRKYAVQVLLAYNVRLREENRLPNQL